MSLEKILWNPLGYSGTYAVNPATTYSQLQANYGLNVVANPTSQTNPFYITAPWTVVKSSTSGLFNATLTGTLAQSQGQNVKIANLTGTGVNLTTASGVFYTSSSITSTGTLVLPTNTVNNFVWDMPSNSWYLA